MKLKSIAIFFALVAAMRFAAWADEIDLSWLSDEPPSDLDYYAAYWNIRHTYVPPDEPTPLFLGYAIGGIRENGLSIYFFTSGREDDSKSSTNGFYTISKRDGEDLVFTFPTGREKAYAIDYAPDGSKATVALKPPFEVEKSEGVPEEPWTDNGDGTLTMNVEIVPGLYYAAAASSSLGGLVCPGSDTPASEGTKLIVGKPEGGSCFYKVWVGEAPLADESVQVE